MTGSTTDDGLKERGILCRMNETRLCIGLSWWWLLCGIAIVFELHDPDVFIIGTLQCLGI